MVEHALGESPPDPVLEGRVRPVGPCFLSHVQRDRRVEQDCGVEQDESLDEAGPAGRDLEREPAAERVPDPGGRPGPDTRKQQIDVLGDAPRRLVR